MRGFFLAEIEYNNSINKKAKVMIIVDHIKFVLNERINYLSKLNLDSYDEGYLDALDFVLNLIEDEEEEICLASSHKSVLSR